MSVALEGRLALVTGASRGIGAAIAVRLASEGASVIVNYAKNPDRARSTVDTIREGGGQAEAVEADLSSLEGVGHPARSVEGVYGGAFAGRLDILVNNAGTIEVGPFLESSQGSYDRHFALNVRAPIELTRLLAPRMVEAGWGRGINMSSVLGEGAPMGGLTLYVASKFAIHGFTRGLSRELGPHGVTVNSIQPGPIATDMAPQPGTDGHGAMVRLTSVGRFGRPTEVAAAAAFLASPEAAYVNGEHLTIDGGWNA